MNQIKEREYENETFEKIKHIDENGVECWYARELQLVLDYKEWRKFEGKLKTLPLTNKNARDLVRFFLSGAVECEIDKQGRFLIPGNLRTDATLEKEIISAKGCIKNIEKPITKTKYMKLIIG